MRTIKKSPIWKLCIDLSIKENFPLAECIHPDKNEKGIYNSDNTYLILYKGNNTNRYTLMYAKPYIWKASDFENIEDFSLEDENETTLYGWIDPTNKSDFIDNICNPIHGTDEKEYVIAYIPTSKQRK